LEIQFTDHFEDWRYERVVVVGGEGNDTSFAASIAITDDGGTRIHVDVLSSAGIACFQDVRCVEGIAYIGFGRYLFVVNTRTGVTASHRLDGYFGHMYHDGDLANFPSNFSVLVTSASEVLAFSRAGDLVWTQGNLGIDGVLVQAVTDQRLDGEGEWDPPGGWRKFSVTIDTGFVI
jgi:hypothetical protein